MPGRGAVSAPPTLATPAAVTAVYGTARRSAVRTAGEAPDNRLATAFRPRATLHFPTGFFLVVCVSGLREVGAGWACLTRTKRSRRKRKLAKFECCSSHCWHSNQKKHRNEKSKTINYFFSKIKSFFKQNKKQKIIKSQLDWHGSMPRCTTD